MKTEKLESMDRRGIDGNLVDDGSDKPSHTPTPWQDRGSNSMGHHHQIGSVHSKLMVAEVFGMDGRAEANAAYIVKAVNAHEGLVEALNAFRHVIGFTHTDTDADQNAVVLALELAEKALAQAEGE